MQIEILNKKVHKGRQGLNPCPSNTFTCFPPDIIYWDLEEKLRFSVLNPVSESGTKIKSPFHKKSLTSHKKQMKKKP